VPIQQSNVYESDVTHPRKLLPNNQPRPNQMSSTLVNYASRVLSVDQESNSFVPIVGLNKTPDLPIFEAVMFAWRGCAILRASVDEDDMEVPHCAHIDHHCLRHLHGALVTHAAGHRNWCSAALHEHLRR
jgi:hypothetical protein